MNRRFSRRDRRLHPAAKDSRKHLRSRRLLVEQLEERTLLTGGLQIIGSSPSSPVNLRVAPLQSLTVTFDRPIDYAGGGGTFTVEDVAITGPDGAIVASSIAFLGGNQYQVAFPAQTHPGTYTFIIGPNIADLGGNLMDQNQNGTPGEVQDVFTKGIEAYDADVLPTKATTLSETHVTSNSQALVAVKANVHFPFFGIICPPDCSLPQDVVHSPLRITARTAGASDATR